MRTVNGARDALSDAVRALRDRGVPEPEASAEVLLSELLGVRRGGLRLLDDPLTEGQAARYGAWISRRADREPVQRILGRAPFRHLVLELSADTLIPRPDTESVVDAALERLDLWDGTGVVLDLGTGSGAIAVSVACERPRAEVHASDVSAAALETARRNAGRAGVSVAFHRADLAAGLEPLGGRTDLLVSNPPYIASGDLGGLAPEVRDHDPRTALDGGPDGLGFFRRIFRETPPLLGRGADVVLEVGDGQAGAVLRVGEKHGFEPLGVRPDLTGAERAVVLRWTGR